MDGIADIHSCSNNLNIPMDKEDNVSAVYQKKFQHYKIPLNLFLLYCLHIRFHQLWIPVYIYIFHISIRN